MANLEAVKERPLEDRVAELEAGVAALLRMAAPPNDVDDAVPARPVIVISTLDIAFAVAGLVTAVALVLLIGRR